MAIGRQYLTHEMDGLDNRNVVFCPTEGHEDEVVYKPPGGVTVGAFYDLVIGQNGVYPNPLGGGWKLLFEIRVRDPHEFRQVKIDLLNRQRGITKHEVKALLEDVEGSATLWLPGGEPAFAKRSSDEEAEPWRPQYLGEEKNTMCEPLK